MIGRRAQRGQVTFLGIGLAIGLLMVGGISVDLWRVLTARRALAEVADAAAAAGANAVDVAHYRRSGQLRLDPELAVALAEWSLAGQVHPDGRPTVTLLDADTDQVTVALERDVELSLLRMFLLDEPIRVGVAAEAVPVRGP